MGSLRLRKDYLMGQGAVAPFAPPRGGQGSYWEACGLAAAPDFEYLATLQEGSDAMEMALARWRQLTAHEIGHTLGFPHNYISSAYGRESVMDYPAPLVEIRNGELDLSNAYVQRIGEYDKLSVTWLYQDFPNGTDERAALEAITNQGMDSLSYSPTSNESANMTNCP